jgi:uroporphyrinogen decarboxylase
MSQRKAAMTEGQRLAAVLNRKKPDRVPNWPFFDLTGFSAVYHQRPVAAAYLDPRESLDMQRAVCRDFQWICSPFFALFGANEFGGEVKLPDSQYAQAPTITRFPVEKEEDVRKLKIPDIKNSPSVAREIEFYQIASKERFDNEPFRVYLPSIEPFGFVGKLCRLELLARWMLRKPEIVLELLQFADSYLAEMIKHWRDIFGTEDVIARSGGVISSNQLISPRLFERFVFPFLKESHRKVLEMGYRHIYCHICGDHNMNMKYWAQVPMGDPGIVSIGHEVELETAAQYFPDDIILGNLEPSILQTGTADEVYEATREVVEKGKRLSGGYIFSLGCQFPPRASLDNARAMNQAIEDYGWYDKV